MRMKHGANHPYWEKSAKAWKLRGDERKAYIDKLNEETRNNPSPRMSMDEYLSIGTPEQYEAAAYKYGGQPWYEEHTWDNYGTNTSHSPYYDEKQSYLGWYDWMPEEIQAKMIAKMQQAQNESENWADHLKGGFLRHPENRIGYSGGFDGIDGRTWNELQALRMPANAQHYLDKAKAFEMNFNNVDEIERESYPDVWSINNAMNAVGGYDNYTNGINYSNRVRQDELERKQALQNSYNAMRQAALDGDIIE